MASKGSVLPISNNKLKKYFLKVRELEKSNEKFPIDLDSIWPLAYSRKDAAKRELRSNFIDNLDYQVLHINVEQTTGARNKEIIMISVQCMEFLIARKHKDVFSVYREIFHKATNEVEGINKKEYEGLTSEEELGLDRTNQVEATKSVQKHLVDTHGEKKGKGKFIGWSKKSHEGITGRTIVETKTLGEQAGLSKTIIKSGKEVCRYIDKSSSYGLCVADMVYIALGDSDAAIKVGKYAKRSIESKRLEDNDTKEIAIQALASLQSN